MSAVSHPFDRARRRRIRRLLQFVTASLFAILSTYTPAGARVPIPQDLRPPMPITEYRPAPTVTARSWIVFDATDGVVLGSHNADEIRPMASTTKIMTALLALELSGPDQLVPVSQGAADVGESEIGLVAGEQIPMTQLITAMVVRSANDAAVAVAESVGGDVATFVELMNQRALELGMTRTTFANPHGLDSEGHMSTARDLLRLGLAAMTNPDFRERARIREFTMQPAPDGRPRVARATNDLLDTYDGAIGVKTGFTVPAGLVLVATAERDGRTVYAVVMGSEGPGGHFADATALLDFGFGGHELVRAVAGQTVYEGGNLLRSALLETQFHIASLLAIEAPVTAEVAVDLPEMNEAALPGLTEALSWLFGGIDSD